MRLNRSEYTADGRKKSCPRCSVRAGEFVYKSLAEFGERQMEDGRMLIQSWCTDCREDGRR